MKTSDYWTCIGVETSVPWPTKETKVHFDGHDFILRPESETNAPSIAFEHGSKGIPNEIAITIVRRFMSSLSWVYGYGLRETFWMGGARQIGIGKSPKWSTQTTHFDPTYLPTLSDPKQKLALALYRDALSTNNIAYKFLGLARILNIIAKTAREHQTWVNLKIGLITDPDALKIVSSLKAKGLDVGEHIYKSGRCAVAHANEDPIVDPDDSSDLRRMHEELPLILSLAQIVIEHELKVKSQSTVWKEHLYELSGFKSEIPKKLIDEVVTGSIRNVKDEEIGLRFTIGLRSKPKYVGLSNMSVLDAEMNQGVLSILLGSSDQTLKIWIGLDLKNERLVYDPYDGMRFSDVGTRDSLEAIGGFLMFKKELFLNGSIEIRNADTDSILGFTDPFIPTNIDLGRTIKNFDASLVELEEYLSKRK